MSQYTLCPELNDSENIFWIIAYIVYGRAADR